MFRRIKIYIALLIVGVFLLLLQMVKFSTYYYKVKLRYTPLADDKFLNYLDKAYDSSEEESIKRKLLVKRIQYMNWEQKKKQKLPDVLVLRTYYCDSNPLTMLSNHPQVQFYPPIGGGSEISVDDIINKREFVTHQMPYINPDIKVINVNTINLDSPPKTLPNKMKEILPNSKIIMVLCDPTERFNAHFDDKKKLGKISESYTKSKYLEKYLQKYEIPSFWKNADDNNALNFLMNARDKDPLSVMLITGFYYYYVTRWLDVFGTHNSLILNSNDLHDPDRTSNTLENIQDFLQIPKLILKEDFMFSNTSTCLQTPWMNLPSCTQRKPSRNEKMNNPGFYFDVLKQFYVPFNSKLKEIVHSNLTQNW